MGIACGGLRRKAFEAGGQAGFALWNQSEQLGKIAEVAAQDKSKGLAVRYHSARDAGDSRSVIFSGGISTT